MTNNINFSSKSAFSPYVKPAIDEKKSSTTQAKVETTIQDYKAAICVNVGIELSKKDFNRAYQIFANCSSYIERHRPVSAAVNAILGDGLSARGDHLRGVECYVAAIIKQDNEQIRNELRTKIVEILKVSKLVQCAQDLPILLDFVQILIKKDIESAMAIFKACVPYIKDRGITASITEKLADEFSLKKANVESFDLYAMATKFQDNEQIQVNILMKVGGIFAQFNCLNEQLKCLRLAYEMQKKLCSA